MDLLVDDKELALEMRTRTMDLLVDDKELALEMRTRTMDLLVDDKELASRRAAWEPTTADPELRGGRQARQAGRVVRLGVRSAPNGRGCLVHGRAPAASWHHPRGRGPAGDASDDPRSTLWHQPFAELS
jgi:hypothetical protein